MSTKNISSYLAESREFAPPAHFAKKANVSSQEQLRQPTKDPSRIAKVFGTNRPKNYSTGSSPMTGF